MQHCGLYKLPQELLDTISVGLNDRADQLSFQASCRHAIFTSRIVTSRHQRKNFQRRMRKDRLLRLADAEVQKSGDTRFRSRLWCSVCKRRHSSAFFTVAQTKEKSPSHRRCISSMYGRVRVCENVSLNFCQMTKLCQEKYWRSQPSICNRHKDNHEPNFYVH
jgi:hypothetical protein